VGTGFHPELTGRENIFLNGAILGMARCEVRQRFDEIVNFADVERFIDTPVKHYSSGMYMRLAFAIAAHLETDTLLVDEVLAVGDAAFQQKCLGRMDNVARQGRTIVLITHQMNQIRQLCGRCIWLDGGRIRMNGPSLEVICAYEASMTTGRGEKTTHMTKRNVGAEFIEWCVPNSNGQSNVIVDHGPVSVRFSLRVNKPMYNAHHGILLYDSNNQIIWSAAENNLILDAGVHELCYEFPSLPLRPGTYSWFVSLWNDGVQIDELQCFPPLIIATPSRMHPIAHLQGILNTIYGFKVQ
jgi:lipopolysaccharide transport system ATP-binding protein